MLYHPNYLDSRRQRCRFILKRHRVGATMKRSQSKVTVKSEQKTEESSSKKSRTSDAVEIKEEINNGEHEHGAEMENAAAVNFVVKKEERKKCPYLDTVNRQLLDFDMEKVCSVTLSNLNVYCCLICGKYFQGRGKSTPAYTHSVASGVYLAHLTSLSLTFSRSIVASIRSHLLLIQPVYENLFCCIFHDRSVWMRNVLWSCCFFVFCYPSFLFVLALLMTVIRIL